MAKAEKRAEQLDHGVTHSDTAYRPRKQGSIASITEYDKQLLADLTKLPDNVKRSMKKYISTISDYHEGRQSQPAP